MTPGLAWTADEEVVVEWACVCAHGGVCICARVYMRVGALSGVCAHVCRCQRCRG